MTREPIAEGLFTGPDGDPALIGGQCAECGRFTFPIREGCSHCGATAAERRTLGQRGTLWTWTSQGFTPKAPYTGQFTEPWLVGLVELPGHYGSRASWWTAPRSSWSSGCRCASWSYRSGVRNPTWRS